MTETPAPVGRSVLKLGFWTFEVVSNFRAALLLILLAPVCTWAVSGELGVEEIIFARRQPGVGGHWYENFGYYAQDESLKVYGARGSLCRLRVGSGALTVLLDDPAGSIRDPQVHYDGTKILFSYRPGGTDYFHLYEINVDGGGLQQLTSGPYDDIEPIYLPDGRIMFCSSRCHRWVPCWYTQVAILHTCDGDGRKHSADLGQHRARQHALAAARRPRDL